MFMIFATNGKRNPIPYEGEHTPLPDIARNGWKLKNGLFQKGKMPSLKRMLAHRKWSRILSENQGLPPNLVHYGAHGRSKPLANMLKSAVLLENGRGSLVLGIYEHKINGKKFKLPVVGYSTGMGLPTAGIFTKEVLAHVANAGEYRFNGETIPAPTINVIRVGTCGGCNYGEGTNALKPVVNRPELVNAEYNYTSLFNPLIDASKVPPQVSIIMGSELRQYWNRRGCELVDVNGWVFLKNANSPEVVNAIGAAAGRLGVLCHNGNALSKNALDFETVNHDIIGKLRIKHNVLASEMEQSVVADLALRMKQFNLKVLTGMVALVIGALPGSGYPEYGNKQHDQEVADGLKNALKVALEALQSLSSSGRKGQ
jgi:uridine phosphorylase